MYQRLAFCLCLLIGLTANAATINVHGKVTNQAGKGIANAILTLVGQSIKDTTGTDGTYTMAPVDVTTLRLLKPQSTTITMNKGVLDFSLVSPAPVKIEIFDVNGKLLKKESLQNAQSGYYRFNVSEISRTSNMLVVHASIGNQTTTFRYLPMNEGKYTVNAASQSITGGKLAKITAISDTVKVTAANYTAKSIVITNYDTTLNIVLDTANGGVTVNLDQERQTIQGFGINGTLVKDKKALPWKQLFSLEGDNALGLSVLRMGMTETGTHRDASSGWEAARDTYKAKIIGSCWSAEGSWKTNGIVNEGGHLKPENYTKWAERIAKFAKDNKLYAMSIANESDFASCGSGSGAAACNPPLTDPYASMVYTAKEMVDFVKVAGPIFKRDAPGIKMIAPEASLWIHVWSNLSCVDKYKSSDPMKCGCFSNNITDATELAKCAAKCNNGDGYDYGHWLAKDTAAWNAFDIMGVHQYESQVAYPWPADVTNGKRSKEVWQTEMSGVMYWPEQGPNTTIENGVAVARWIQSALTIGEASAWCYWWYESYYQNDNEGLAIIQGSSTIAKRYYAMGNYSRYMRPDQKIVNITGTDKLPAKVLLTASKDAAGKVVIVAVNETTSVQTVDITIAGGTAPASFTPIVTDKDNNWKEGTAVTVSGGVLKAELGKMSVTTFVSK